MIFFIYVLIIESFLKNTVTRQVLHRLLVPYVTMILYCSIKYFVSGVVHFGWFEHILAWGAASQMKNDNWEEIKSTITNKQFGIATRLTAFALYVIYNIQV